MMILFLLLALWSVPALSFILPGTLPVEYHEGSSVPVKVNSITSSITHLGYDYYSLPFCRPDKIENAAENLGEHLMGNTIHNTIYDIRMAKSSYCNILCYRDDGVGPKHNGPIRANELDLLINRISKDYHANFIIDGLIVGTTGIYIEVETEYSMGVPIGFVDEAGAIGIFNHYRFYLDYHSDPSYDGYRVVGARIEPVSADMDPTNPLECSPANGPLVKKYKILKGSTQSGIPPISNITFTYDVIWTPSDVAWASRWDAYLSAARGDTTIHWFFIGNALVIALFMTGLVAFVVGRSLSNDFKRYSAVPTAEANEHVEGASGSAKVDIQDFNEIDELGWKLVHGDVFRTPIHQNLLAIFAGIGAQITCMFIATLGFAVIGFLSPANRGALTTALLVLFLGCGIVAGYVTARIHKMFNGTRWQRMTTLTAFSFPFFLFTVVFIVNLFVWKTGSTNAISFKYMVAVGALWLLMSVPLVFLGAYYGFKADKIEPPIRVNSIPRIVPPQRWYFSLPLHICIGGLLPFGTVWLELNYILNSVWRNDYQYIFGFILFAFLLLLVTSAEVSVMSTYFLLCSENYNWWWRSFIVPASSGIYFFAFCIFYFVTSLNMGPGVPSLLYFAYMGVGAMLFSFVTGTVGLLASYVFVKKIYTAIRID